MVSLKDSDKVVPTVRSRAVKMEKTKVDQKDQGQVVGLVVLKDVLQADKMVVQLAEEMEKKRVGMMVEQMETHMELQMDM